jgi:photoactive yellow protein
MTVWLPKQSPPHTGSTMNTDTRIAFNESGLLQYLESASDADLDELDFGVIGFDPATLVTRYNHFESSAAGLSRERVLGQAFFAIVAPCMNNFMVAQRFEDAAEDGEALDDIIDYVLTLRMRPIKVKLRLLAQPGAGTRYVLVHRLS